MTLVDKIFNYISSLYTKGRLLLSTFLFLFISCKYNTNIELKGITMGTTYSIIIHDGSSSLFKNKEIQIKVDSILYDINNIFSTYIDTSEINKINNSFKDTIAISKHFMYVLNQSFNINKKTYEMFDPTIKPLIDLWNFNFSKVNFIPPKIGSIEKIMKNIGLNNISIKNDLIIKKNNATLDFNAIAKGYAIDVIGNYFISCGYKNFMIEIGGEVLCKGKNNNKTWSIGLQNPFIQEDFFDIIFLNDKAIATSGTYRNFYYYNDILYSHIINPKTGFPVSHNTVSVSVIADNCLIADAYATGLIVLGAEKGVELVDRIEGLEAVFILGDRDKYSFKFSKNYKNFIK